jgi:hypothetical protein
MCQIQMIYKINIRSKGKHNTEILINYLITKIILSNRVEIE